MNENASDYLKRITGEKSVRAIALRIGVAPTTIGRQIESELRPELLVRICREYGIPVLPELVAIGFITESEAKFMTGANALVTATDEQLAKEILRRVQDSSATSTLTEPMDVDSLSDPLPGNASNVGGQSEDDIPHLGKVELDGYALAAHDEAGVDEEQERSQETP